MTRLARLAIGLAALGCVSLSLRPALLPATAQAPSAIADTTADLLVVNGKVVTVDGASTVTEAVAVRGDRIVAVGTSARLRSLAGPQTRVIDARGRTVIPGLIDSHVHALGAAPVEAVSPFRTLASVAEVQDWLRQAAGRSGTAASSSSRVGNRPSRKRVGYTRGLHSHDGAGDRPAA